MLAFLTGLASVVTILTGLIIGARWLRRAMKEDQRHVTEEVIDAKVTPRLELLDKSVAEVKSAQAKDRERIAKLEGIELGEAKERNKAIAITHLVEPRRDDPEAEPCGPG